ncbi:MAG: magnesium and cobalt transport protein CorA [Pseudomonadota bacterium]|nr:magnesium and cobalt transport protein CorA [Pseudomonadota bacterium]
MIVNSIAYRHGKPLADIPLDDISDAIADPNTFVWLGLHEVDHGVLLKIQQEFGLHDLAVEDASKAHQRSKIETYGDTLFIVIKTAELFTPGGGQPLDDPWAQADLDDGGTLIRYGETHFFVGNNFLISVRHGNAQGYASVRRRCEEKNHMLEKGPAYALYALMDFIVDNYHPIVAALADDFGELEGRIFTRQFDHSAIENLYAQKRKLMELRNAVQPVEDICLQLTRLHPELIHKDLRAYFRDIHDHAARTVEALDNQREMLTTAMSVNLALVTVRQNEIVKRLAGWGAILAVPTVVFSLYGMNFRHMPELDWPLGYPLLLGGTVAVCVLFHRRLKKAGWL